jgi:hypothetical protein
LRATPHNSHLLSKTKASIFISIKHPRIRSTKLCFSRQKCPNKVQNFVSSNKPDKITVNLREIQRETFKRQKRDRRPQKIYRLRGFTCVLIVVFSTHSPSRQRNSQKLQPLKPTKRLRIGERKTI